LSTYSCDSCGRQLSIYGTGTCPGCGDPDPSGFSRAPSSTPDPDSWTGASRDEADRRWAEEQRQKAFLKALGIGLPVTLVVVVVAFFVLAANCQITLSEEVRDFVHMPDHLCRAASQ
jgi:hypothetical protein